MRDRHELSVGRSPEDSVVRCLEIHHLKGHVLGPEILPSAERDRQSDLPEWYHRGPGDHLVERRVL